MSTSGTTITFDFDIQIARLKSALLTDDDLGAVIRCHIEAERCLFHVLSRITNGRFKSADYRSFEATVKAAKLIGVNPKFLTPMSTLNGHRNSFAHKGKETINEQDYLDLVRQVRFHSKEFTDNFRLTLTNSMAFDKMLSDSTVKEKYVICCAFLISHFASLPHRNKEFWYEEG